MTTLRIKCGFWADRQGVVALDFALLIPLILLILVGFFETYLFFRAASITERVAFSVANMVAERRTLYDCKESSSGDYLGAYFRAADILASNIDPEREGVVIVSAIRSKNGQPYLAWQRRTPGRSLKVTSAFTNPASADLGDITIHDNDDTLIVAEAFYAFDPFPRANALGNLVSEGGVAESDKADQEIIPALIISRRAYFRARYGLLGDLTSIGGCTPLSQ